MLPVTASLINTGVQAGTSLLGAFLSYLGMDNQIDLYKQQLADTKDMFNQQRADTRYQFDTTMGEQSRQFDKGYGLKKQNSAMLFSFHRGLDIQRKGLDAQLAEISLARKEAAAQKKKQSVNVSI
jgi:hypothetical protein